MDIKHRRCGSFKTLSVHVYYPILRRIVTLATIECEDETTRTLALFWKLLNEALPKVSCNPNQIFNPIGWMAYEAGANWAGLKKVFDPDVIKRTVGCQFHYRQCQQTCSSISQC